MKKVNILLLIAALALSAWLLCSCNKQTQVSDVVGDREIVKVYIFAGSYPDDIYPCYDFGNGNIRNTKGSNDTPVKTYPISVDFHGDFVEVNYYVNMGSYVYQQTVLTGKDNVAIYMQ